MSEEDEEFGARVKRTRRGTRSKAWHETNWKRDGDEGDCEKRRRVSERNYPLQFEMGRWALPAGAPLPSTEKANSDVCGFAPDEVSRKRRHKMRPSFRDTPHALMAIVTMLPTMVMRTIVTVMAATG